MSSTCFRAATRMASSAFRSAAAARSSAAAAAGRTSSRRIASSPRMPVELGFWAGGSLLPLHSAVATARLTSRLSTATRSCCALSQEMGLSVRR